MEKRSIMARGEDGFAALVIAIVLVLVLSLITVGFAELMRREERSALDKQLSSQAFYAAETGVNDATKAISDGYLGSKTECGPGRGTAAPTPANSKGLSDIASNVVAIDATHNPTGASYPCLLINPAPPNLHYDSIATTASRTLEFTAVDAAGTVAPVSKIQISWQDSHGNQTFISGAPSDCTGNFTSAWPYVGVLRAQLIPLTTGLLDRDGLANSAMTAFLCPNRATAVPGPGVATYADSIGPTKSGSIINGNCRLISKPLVCNATINGPFPATSTFFLNLRSIYSATAVTITAYNGGTPLFLKGAQTLVDSTGKAQDVLRRIQVRIPTSTVYDIPDGTHADICKQFNLDPLSTTSHPDAAGCETSNLAL